MPKSIAHKTVPFTKKNTLALADQIYSDKKGVITFLKLCGRNLSKKDGGRTLHCSLGEAYYTFVSEDFQALYDLTHDLNDATDATDATGAIDVAIGLLVEKAKLKNPTTLNKKKLGAALLDAVNSNDQIDDNCDDNYFERADTFACILRDRVAPLLK